MRPLVLILLLTVSALAAENGNSTLHLLCWSEYVPPPVLDGFTAATGRQVLLETYTSNEQMLERLHAKPGYFDIVQPSGYYVRTLAEAGELEPIDFARVPNAANLDPKFWRLPFDPDARYSVPWLVGTVGIVINMDRIQTPVHSWADVFDGTHAGRIVVIDDPREMVAWALATLGRSITDVSDEALRQVEPLLKKWLPQVKVFNSDSPKTALLDGRVEIGIIWSGEAALLWQMDHKYRYVLPSAGAHMFVDSLAIPKNAPHRELAMAFINHCLAPDVSVQISNAFPYTNPNLAARRLLKPEQLANPASYPPQEADLPMLRNEGNTTATVSAFVRRIREELKKESK